MRTLQSNNGAFEKVGECLYRYSNGVYYARIKIDGKQIKRSLLVGSHGIQQRASVAQKSELTEPEHAVFGTAIEVSNIH